MSVPELADLMDITVTYKVPTGRDGNGDPVFGAATTIGAYVDRERKVVPGRDGSEQMTTHIITSDEEIPEECKIWVPPASPDDDEGRTPLYVSRFSDPEDPNLIIWEAGL
jgi:hypothetical protein